MISLDTSQSYFAFFSFLQPYFNDTTPPLHEKKESDMGSNTWPSESALGMTYKGDGPYLGLTLIEEVNGNSCWRVDEI
jgi:hypothetical protein